MIKWLKSNWSLVVLVLLALALACFVVSCKSFDVEDYVREGQPDECNDSYIFMGFYSTVEKSDAAMIGVVYTECKTAREQKRKMLREEHCRKMIFGDKPLDKDQYKLYAQYLECSKL